MSNARELSELAGSYGTGGFVGMKNRIINGGMAINQRGTQSASPLNGYTLDRWLFSRSGSGTSTVSQTATANYGGRYSLTAVSAHAAGEIFGVEQRIESFNCSDLAGSTVTIQFYASATTSAGALGTFNVAASYATATDNFSSTTSISSTTFVPTSTPTLFTAQFAIPSAATTGLKIQFSGGQISATGTVTFNLGGVQLEKGSTATSFDYRPYGTELALCQRYFENVQWVVNGYWAQWTGVEFYGAQFPFMVEKRNTPSIANFTASGYWTAAGQNAFSASGTHNFTISNANTKCFNARSNRPVGNATPTQASMYLWEGSVPLIGVNAEL